MSGKTRVDVHADDAYAHISESAATAHGGTVPLTRTINGKPLSANVTLTTDDVSAVPTTRTINGKPLSANVTLTPADVGAVLDFIAAPTGGTTEDAEARAAFVALRDALVAAGWMLPEASSSSSSGDSGSSSSP